MIKNLVLSVCVVLTALGTACAGHAQPPSTTVQWFGHAAFKIVTPKSTVLLIDPWLSNPRNPVTTQGRDPLAEIGRVDYILITHGHFDHVGEAVEIAKRTGARLVANFELGTNLVRVLGYPEDQVGFDTLMNSGGEISIANGEVTIAMTPAVHSSSLEPPSKSDKKQPLVFAGNANGFVLKIRHGPTLYHSGDTAYFGDMQQISRYKPDVALVNVGGHFGMEPEMAAKAVRTVGARIAIPMHFGTFPILASDLTPFKQALQSARITAKELSPGESIVFSGAMLPGEMPPNRSSRKSAR